MIVDLLFTASGVTRCRATMAIMIPGAYDGAQNGADFTLVAGMLYFNGRTVSRGAFFFV